NSSRAAVPTPQTIGETVPGTSQTTGARFSPSRAASSPAWRWITRGAGQANASNRRKRTRCQPVQANQSSEVPSQSGTIHSSAARRGTADEVARGTSAVSTRSNTGSVSSGIRGTGASSSSGSSNGGIANSGAAATPPEAGSL